MSATLGQMVFYRNTDKWYAAVLVGNVLPPPFDTATLVVFNHNGITPAAKLLGITKYDPANPLNNTWYETAG